MECSAFILTPQAVRAPKPSSDLLGRRVIRNKARHAPKNASPNAGGKPDETLTHIHVRHSLVTSEFFRPTFRALSFRLHPVSFCTSRKKWGGLPSHVAHCAVALISRLRRQLPPEGEALGWCQTQKRRTQTGYGVFALGKNEEMKMGRKMRDNLVWKPAFAGGWRGKLRRRGENLRRSAGGGQSRDCPGLPFDTEKRIWKRASALDWAFRAACAAGSAAASAAARRWIRPPRRA